MKKILIDLQSCQSGSRKGGIGRYSIQLVEKIIELYSSEYDFYILLNGTIGGENEIRSYFGNLLAQTKFITLNFPKNVYESKTIVENQEYKTQLAENLVDLFLCEFKPDYFLITSFVEGLDENVVTAIRGIYPKERIGVILYDLIPLVMADKYLTNHVLERHYLRKIEEIKKAGKLYAISEYSRSQAADVDGFSIEKITNISSAVSSDFKVRNLSHDRILYLREKYKIKNKFLLFTGSFDSRKNHEKLIEAYALLSKQLRSDYQLVIVGNGWPDKYSQLLQHAKNNGILDGRVIFCGHVDDEELIDIYNIADLFVFPSLSEGFGLPVLEAMSCGTPVIGSNTTSIVEAVGLKEALFDPTTVDSISEKIRSALTDKHFYNLLKKHASKHAENFSWQKSADRLMQVIANDCVVSELNPDVSQEKAFENFLINLKTLKKTNDIPHEYLVELADSIRSNEITCDNIKAFPRKLRYAWITTWNTRCGIASYSKSLMESIDGHHRVFAPFSNDLLSIDLPNVKRCWNVGSDSLENLINHVESSDADVVVIQMNHGFFDFAELANLILAVKNSGLGLIITLHSTIDPPPDVLDRSLKTISQQLALADTLFVHTLDDIKNLNMLGLASNLKIIPQGYKAYQSLSVKKKIDSNTFVIATFGFMLKHKGIIELIQAYPMINSKSGLHVKLKLLNSSYSDAASGLLINEAKSLINSLNLQDDVIMINDYLEHQEIFAQLASADLIIFPYQNTSESSSAAVRSALPVGVPIAVTPIPIFNDVRQCSHVLPGTSPSDLARGISDVICSIQQDDLLSRKINNATKNWCHTNSFAQVGQYFSQQANLSFSLKLERLSHDDNL